MLTLRRHPTARAKPGEDRIHIGPDIVVVVKQVREGRVHIAIEAPMELEIRRGEYHDMSKMAEREGVYRS